MIRFDLSAFCRPEDAFVELGTGLGGGIETALTCDFSHLYSVEVDPSRCAAAMVRFRESIVQGRLTLYCGTSAEWMPYICGQLAARRAVWWVDAHVDHPAATRAPTPCSLLDDLAGLVRHERHGDTVLVDDRRLLGQPGWGRGIEEAAVREWLARLHPKGHLRLLNNVRPDDVIVSEPTS